ncbi:MAG TPA: sugar phosphate isomerase/epimerase family protein [Tepidisphaeraceae bacterium]|jgi:sugar phosphate isomerase/epimerase
MQFGICSPVSEADNVKAAGADYLEIGAQTLPVEPPRGLPIRACNALVPAALKITGPEVNSGKLRDYLEQTCINAKKVGAEILVFGSAGARNVPEGFDQKNVQSQLLDFLRAAGWAAMAHGLTIVIEPLERKESNILHTIDESMELVKLVNLPGVQCLVDTYHFWVNGDSLESLRKAMPHIYHVHVADLDGRVAPGLSGKADYQPLFHVLKEAGYNRRISIEALNFDIARDGKKAMEYLRQEWQGS